MCPARWGYVWAYPLEADLEGLQVVDRQEAVRRHGGQNIPPCSREMAGVGLSSGWKWAMNEVTHISD